MFTAMLKLLNFLVKLLKVRWKQNIFLFMVNLEILQKHKTWRNEDWTMLGTQTQHKKMNRYESRNKTKDASVLCSTTNGVEYWNWQNKIFFSLFSAFFICFFVRSPTFYCSAGDRFFGRNKFLLLESRNSSHKNPSWRRIARWSKILIGMKILLNDGFYIFTFSWDHYHQSCHLIQDRWNLISEFL